MWCCYRFLPFNLIHIVQEHVKLWKQHVYCFTQSIPCFRNSHRRMVSAVRNMINENHRDLLIGTFSGESKAVMNFNPSIKHFLCPKADFFETCLRRIAEFCIPFLYSGSLRTRGESLLFSTILSRQFPASCYSAFEE